MAQTQDPSNNVLVLEDEAQFAALIADVVREAGSAATVVRSIDAFRDAYARVSPSMLVLDIVLGNEDVCSALDFLGQQRCAAPIILMSGYDHRMRKFVASVARDRGLHVADAIDKRDGFARLQYQLRAHSVARGGQATH